MAKKRKFRREISLLKILLKKRHEAKTSIIISKSVKKLEKVEKPIQRDVNAAMIIETLNELTSKLDNGKGAPLVSIRNYIAKTHGLKMIVSRQTMIKEIIAKEFHDGRIKMTNHSGTKINFKRFDVVTVESRGDRVGNSPKA